MPGKHWEEFEPGHVMRHAKTKTVDQREHAEFCRITDNDQPLHLDEAAAKASPYGRILVNGLLPIAWGVGVSVRDTTDGTLVANLGYEEVRNTAPVHPGDTLRCETTVVEKRRTSKPERGLVVLKHDVYNQRSELVTTLKRIVLVKVKHP